MNDEEAKKAVRSMSPATGTQMPLQMTRDQFVNLQEAFVKIAEGTQDLIAAVKLNLEETKRDNARTRVDNTRTQTFVILVHAVGMLVVLGCLVGIVHRSELIIRAAAALGGDHRPR